MSLNTYLLKPGYNDKITPESIHVAYSKFGHDSNKCGKTDKFVIYIRLYVSLFYHLNVFNIISSFTNSYILPYKLLDKHIIHG